MKTQNKFLLILLLLITSGCSKHVNPSSSISDSSSGTSETISDTTSESTNEPRLNLVDSINATEVKNDIEYLASSELGGRNPGTEGNELATQFVANRFEMLGLEPYKDDTYFQPLYQKCTKIPMSYPTLYTYNESTLEKTEYEYSFDWKLIPFEVPESAEYDLNYTFNVEEADENTILIAPRNSIPSFYHNYKYLIPISNDYFPFVEYGSGNYFNTDMTNGFKIYISTRMMENIELDYLNEQKKIRINWNYDISGRTMNNVIGILRGGKAVNDGHIVISAHLDHLGRYGEKDHQYFPGALDNASGTAGMLQLAKILSEVRDELKINIVFAAYNSEDAGLLGSNFYPSDPALPLSQNLKLVLNLDMIGSIADNASNLEIFGLYTNATKNRLTQIFEKFDISAYSFGPNQAVSDHYALSMYTINSFTICHYDTTYYHTLNDTIEYISESTLEKHLSAALYYLGYNI